MNPWWNVVINVALAGAFLWRLSPLSRIRDGLLICYCVTTYAIATVEGSAWQLIAMGIAQSKDSTGNILLAYTVTFLLVVVYANLDLFELAIFAGR